MIAENFIQNKSNELKPEIFDTKRISEKLSSSKKSARNLSVNRSNSQKRIRTRAQLKNSKVSQSLNLKESSDTSSE